MKFDHINIGGILADLWVLPFVWSTEKGKYGFQTRR